MSELHTILTVVFFVIFVGIIVRTYSRGQRKDMNDAAQIPLMDDMPAPGRSSSTSDKSNP